MATGAGADTAAARAWAFRGWELVLASASPRRVALLREVGARFTVAPAALDEERLAAGVRGGAAHLAMTLALAKAATALARGLPPALAAAPERVLVLGADTLVVTPDGDTCGQPPCVREAAAMLGRLAGRWHEVVTAVALLAPAGWVRLFTVTSRVRLAALEAASLQRYLATGLWQGKAGAYGLQDDTRLVAELNGSRSNVIGLPLEALAAELARLSSASSAPPAG